MKKTPERIESLAAEYVLGSLKGQARARFERWMMESSRVRQEVWFWEEKLGQLSSEVPPVTPPRSAWQAIERRLWPKADPASASAGQGVRWLWPGWSLAATAAAVVLAVLLVQQPVQTPTPQLSGAIVQADISDPLWLVSESGRDNLLKLRSVAASAADAGKDYELWIVPEDGQPLSLGVIPAGGVHQVTLSDEARTALSQSRTLAISLEPRGGSPTGAPTGPILHVTKLYEL
ncbi:anti-sigma factor [Marinobacter arenosus]|uniref:anti-sigma factor n=1 Tax=Marinobacter arenosus TaxID=2856822 RepID=UPI001C4D6B4C|nr:anti-sigma factor [Marinobacter arenosus]MBW0148287.1 anti-sigma factor [Marinobacter arenosus]